MSEPTLERMRQAIADFRRLGGEIHVQAVYPSQDPMYFTRTLGEHIESNPHLVVQILAEEAVWFEAHIPAAS